MTRRAQFVLALALLATTGWAQNRSEVERSLKSEYEGKVLTQRRFLTGEELMYADDGTSESSTIGPWTTDAEIRVLKIKLRNEHTIEIKGERLFLGYEVACQDVCDVLSVEGTRKEIGKEVLKKLQDIKKVKVKITSKSKLDDAKARAALGKVFLRPDENLADFVPEFWKDALAPRKPRPDAAPVEKEQAGVGIYKVGAGAQPPRPLYHPDPK